MIKTKNSLDINSSNKGYAIIRPKLTKFTEEDEEKSLSIGRGRKKSKFKLKERSASSVRDKYSNDPAYTEDVRHLALPMRRNSGPESESCRRYLTEQKKKSRKSDSLQLSYCDLKQLRKRINVSRESININKDNSSSSEHVQKLGHNNSSKRGLSLDRKGFIPDYVEQQKKSSWFQREKSSDRVKTDKKAKQKRNKTLDDFSYGKTNSLEYNRRASFSNNGENVIETQRSSRSRQKQSHRQNPGGGGSGDYSKKEPSENKLYDKKHKDLSLEEQQQLQHQMQQEHHHKDSKLQIGKRFLKGEIGIKSFNYYLIKEGLKSTKKSKQKPQHDLKPIVFSKSEENIYEEIYFADKPKDVEKEPKYLDCAICVEQCKNLNCGICNGSATTGSHPHQPPPQPHHHDTTSKHNKQYDRLKTEKNYKFYEAQFEFEDNPNVLHYQSYNPKNPNIYKIETTPVAFNSDYNPILQLDAQPQPPQPHQIYYHQSHANMASEAPKLPNRNKSSSSSDSMNHKKVRRHTNEYARPTVHHNTLPHPGEYSTVHQPKIYKAGSSASILSESSLKKYHPGASGGVNAYGAPHHHHHRTGNMSDSSLGDSLFSNPASRRYFGSSESCRFGFECRRCSLDGDRCSFSDTCRNCDCSSSYFSSDFDDNNANFSRRSSTRMSIDSHRPNANQYIDQKTTRYAEDFIKHVNNVKRNNQQQQQQQQHHHQQQQQQQFLHQQQSHQYADAHAGGGVGPPHRVSGIYSKVDNKMTKTKNTERNNENSHFSSENLLFENKMSKSSAHKKYASPNVNPNPNSKSNQMQSNEIDDLNRHLLEKNQKLMMGGGGAGVLPAPGGQGSGGNGGNSGPGRREGSRKQQHHQNDDMLSYTLPNKEKFRQYQSTNDPKNYSQSLNTKSLKATGTVPKANAPHQPPPPSHPSGEPQLKLKSKSTNQLHSTGEMRLNEGALAATPMPGIFTAAPVGGSNQLHAKRSHSRGHNVAPSSYSLDRNSNARYDVVKSVRGVAESVAIDSTISAQGMGPALADDPYPKRMAEVVPAKEIIATKQESKFVANENQNYKTPPQNSNQDGNYVKDLDGAAANEEGNQVAGPGEPPRKAGGRNEDEAQDSVGDDDNDDDVFVDRKAYETPKINNRRKVSSNATSNTSSIDTDAALTTLSISLRTATTTTASTSDSSTTTKMVQSVSPPTLPALPQQQQQPGTISHNVGEREKMRKSETTKRQRELALGPTTAADAKLAASAAAITAAAVANTIADDDNAAAADDDDSHDDVADDDADDDYNADADADGVAVESGEGAVEKAMATVGSTTKLNSTLFSLDLQVAVDTANRDQIPHHQQQSQLNENDANQQLSREVHKSKADTNNIFIGNDDCDISDFPLPDIPIKSKKNSNHNNNPHNTETNDNADKLSFNEKLETESSAATTTTTGAPQSDKSDERSETELDSMHYRNSKDKPTYLFGETLQHHPNAGNTSGGNGPKNDEIFLNKSGWVQVNQRSNFENVYLSNSRDLVTSSGDIIGRNVSVLRKDNVNKSKAINQYLDDTVKRHNKIDDMINRNESRKVAQKANYKQDNVTILKIDPQTNDRPLYLPVKHSLINNSPPPVTPILSPPPAFQDSKTKNNKYSNDNKVGTKILLSVVDNDGRNAKGMVFSKSFEYDNRRRTEYNEQFSKSFDYDLNVNSLMPNIPILRREKSPTFSTLTGSSPNYLTKRDKIRDTSPIFPKSIPGNSVNMGGMLRPTNPAPPPTYSGEIKPMEKYISLDEATASRSRRSQFHQVHDPRNIPETLGFRSLDTSISQRLNSCDSGARSDISNDDEEDDVNEDDGDDDDDDDDDEEHSSSLALSYKSTASQISSNLRNKKSYSSVSSSHGSIKKQRSLTPEKIYDDSIFLNEPRTNLQKQRSLTPERRTHTPDDRTSKLGKQKLKNEFNSSQSSLLSRQSTSSRNSTLERTTKRFEECRPDSSRSSSSSSYSGEPENASYRRSQQKHVSRSNSGSGDHKIRRSRSLQLAERSPSRNQPHKVIVRLGNVPVERPNYSQSRNMLNIPAPTEQIRNNLYYKNSTNTLPFEKVSKKYIANKNNTFMYDNEKSKSFEDENEKINLEFDKSKSFDDDYNNDNDKRKFAVEARSFSHDRVFSNNHMSNMKNLQLQQQQQQQQQQLLQHQQLRYSNKLYDRPKKYESTLKAQSLLDVTPPSIINYHQRNNSLINRDRSPNNQGRLMRGGDLYYTANVSPPEHYGAMRNNISAADSDFDSHAPDFEANETYSSNNIKQSDENRIQEAELIKKFLYKTKQESYLNQRANNLPNPALSPNSGSCTASSCDFWPHCGVTTTYNSHSNINNSNHSNNHATSSHSQNTNKYLDTMIQTKSGSVDSQKYKNTEHYNYAAAAASTKNASAGLHVTKTNITNESKSAASSPTSTATAAGAIKVKPPIYDKLSHTNRSSSSIVFLGEREMPITSTRDGVFKTQNKSSSFGGIGTGSAYHLERLSTEQNNRITFGMGANRMGASSMASLSTPNIGIAMATAATATGATASVAASSSTPSSTTNTTTTRQSYGNGNHLNTVKTNEARINLTNVLKENKLRSQLYKTRYSSNKRRLDMRLKSRSLPKSFLRFRNLTDDVELSSIFTSNMPLQMKAISSPSLSENPIELTAKKSNESEKPNSVFSSANQSAADRTNHPHVSGSVLQKFKKTLSQFKGKTPNTNNANANHNHTDLGETKHRFGPLVWRSSKERRKTKTHRRDKCNSGDSGIQVELENDENINSIDGSMSIETSPSVNVKVRRANSAKMTTTTVKGRVAKKMETENYPETVTTLNVRSLSQPSGLDRLSKHRNRHESDSDSETSNIDDAPVYGEVLYSFTPGGPQELGLTKGALVEVLRRDPGPWWWGQIKLDAIITNPDDLETLQGWFPKDFIRVIPTFHKRKSLSILTTHNDDDMSPPNSQIINSNIKNCDIPNFAQCINNERTSIQSSSSTASQQNSELISENVIKELLETEINYVKLLGSLCTGFMKDLKEHNEIFSSESVNIIFSNLEKIWVFQQTFVEALKQAIANNRIGEVFLEYQSAFMVYSSYCNSYPRALMELENYSAIKEASAVLENCRVSQSLPELPLSAHLLAPIQRICRYPLHLSELVKHYGTQKEVLSKMENKNLSKSEIETIDCKEVFEKALVAMKRVTEMVNEGKRHSEYLSRIQSRFENFQGPSINVHSTRLFLQTDAIRISSPNLWNNTYTLFLFDRQLIYCKKDLLKRTNYIYKGRIFLDNCRILNLPDGKMFGVTLKNALRIFCDSRNKWFDFCFRSHSSKLRLLNTLSAERQFCGENFFVSELSLNNMDDDMSDKEYINYDNDNIDDDAGSVNPLMRNVNERGVDIEAINHVALSQNAIANSNANESTKTQQSESPTKLTKLSDTLPKKSKKNSKDQQHLNQQQQAAAAAAAAAAANIDFHTNSLGRRRLGNWFRKAKSTNSTPSQSPTHLPLSLSAVPNSDSSSQSSPGLNNRASAKMKVKEGSVIIS